MFVMPKEQSLKVYWVMHIVVLCILESLLCQLLICMQGYFNVIPYEY
jgi:hypothetical protein